MGFEYFISREKSAEPRASLESLGLLPIIGDQVETVQTVIDGAPGTLIRPVGPKARFDALSGPMTWRRFKDYKVGHREGSPPAPDDLKRPDEADGYLAELSDGNKWLLPTARALPSYLGVDDDGVRVNRVLGKWRDLSEAGAEVFEAWRFASGEVTEGEHLTLEREHEICVMCLAANYMVGPAECDMLRILTPEDRKNILFALIDLPGSWGGDDAGAGVDKKKDLPAFGLTV